MDELKFREWMDLIKGVLKIFVDAKKDNWETFINELNKFDKALINKCLSHRSSKPKSNEKVNGVRVDVLKKLSEWEITFDEANEIFEKSKKDYNYENRKLFGVLYPIYYFKYDNLIKNFLDNLEKSILNDSWIDWLKSWWNDFNWWQNQWTDKIYIWFFNSTHPTWESAIQFRVQSKWSNKIIIWLFRNKNYIDWKFKEFSIDTLSYQDILDEANKYKEEIINDKMVELIDYIKENIDKYWDIKEKAKKEREDFNKRFPLDKLKNLTLEEYNTWMWNANNGTFTWYLNTEYAISWRLFSNWQNWLFFKGEDWKYKCAKTIDYLERWNWDLNTAFQLYKDDLYNFVKNFDINKYNPQDFLDWAKYIKAALILLYKWDIFLTLWLVEVCIQIVKHLKILSENAIIPRKVDIIEYDLMITDYLKKEIPDIINQYWYSALGKCVYDYYSTYLYDRNKDKKVNKEKIESNGEQIYLPSTTNMTTSKIDLNTILYWVPGTWKTYNTINYALSIIEDKSLDDIDKEDRTELKRRFEEYKEKWQIVFTTFHQSFWYEDFVEWIKANVESNWQINYSVEDWIFKKLCNFADYTDTYVSADWKDINVDKVNIFKMSLWVAWEDDDIYDYCINNDVISIGFADYDFSDIKKTASPKEIKEYVQDKIPENEDKFLADAIFRFKNWMNVWDIVIISKWNLRFRAIWKVSWEYFYDDNSPIWYKHFRKVEWLIKNVDIPVERIQNKKFSMQTIYNLKDDQYKQTSLNLDAIKGLLWVKKTEKKPYVLIIDEINRWNISKIFWELITLLEPDKRLWWKEELKVKLPYSHEEFWVPNNLYVLWTMNTADRSIALIDLALRRRFKFREIEPNSELLKDIPSIEWINVQSLFETINKRIEFLYDRDHLLWHAYFLPLKAEPTLEKLNSIMTDNIIPLLQEYFHDDWEKIQLVLWDWIIKSEMVSVKDLWINSSEYEDQPRYSINTNISAQDYPH